MHVLILFRVTCVRLKNKLTTQCIRHLFQMNDSKPLWLLLLNELKRERRRRSSFKDDEDEEGEEGGLSNSGKELKKLLGKAAGANESNAEDDDDDVQLIIDIFRHLNVDEDDENTISPVLAPKDAPKDELAGNSTLKPTSGSARGTPSTSKSIKGKRISGSDEVKTANGAPAKKIKVENESNSSVKVEPPSSPKTSVAPTGSGSTNVKIEQSSSGSLITEAEIRAAILEKAQTVKELVSRFKPRIKTMQDKKSFIEIMKKIARINKKNGLPFVKLKE